MIKNRRLNLLGLLNLHKELIDKLDLAEVSSEFVPLNEERFKHFSKFVKFNFT